ncbi:hypothetical protein [Streptomyces sp. NPDC090025]|uniref:hypothetical protein n=1 Tax=Streptomyces sp. NPDC090025 TaxID=3365922 RepID=UPI003833404B
MTEFWRQTLYVLIALNILAALAYGTTGEDGTLHEDLGTREVLVQGLLADQSDTDPEE